MQNLKKEILIQIGQTTIVHDRESIVEKFIEEARELIYSIELYEEENTKQEIADVLIVLVQMMNMFGFDEKDLSDKLDDVTTRYSKK